MQISRNNRVWIILLCVFFSSYFSYQGIISTKGTPETINLSIPIYFPRWNQTFYENNVMYIWKPNFITNSPLPVIILINGDSESATALTYPRNAFLEQGYCVAIIEISVFSSTTFHKLNASLNYLLNRTDLDSQQISIMGHSHGGHYALFFGAMRNESIQAVIMANFGSVDILWEDYYEYYSEFVELNATLTKELFISNRTKPFNFNSPRNLLLLTDKWDNRPDYPLEQYLEIISGGNFNQTEILHGSFENGSARKLIINQGIFGHGAILFDPNAMLTAIDWMNQVNNLETSTNLFSVVIWTCVIGWTLIIFIIITGFALAGKIMMLIPKQNNVYEKIHHRISIKWNYFNSSLRWHKKSQTKVEQNLQNSENPQKHQKSQNSLEPLIVLESQNQNSTADSNSNPLPKEEYKKQTKRFWGSMGKALIGLFILNYFIILGHIDYYVWNFLDFILSSIGIYSWVFSYLISNNYPIEYLFFWFPIFLLILRKTFPQEHVPNIFDHSLKTTLFKGALAIEYFIPIFIVYRIILRLLLGDIILGIPIKNLIIGLGFLLLINHFILELMPKFTLTQGHPRIKNIFAQCCLIGVFTLPMVLEITPYGIIFNFSSQYMYVILGIFIWNIGVNSWLYKKFQKDLFTLTIFEYLFLGFI